MKKFVGVFIVFYCFVFAFPYSASALVYDPDDYQRWADVRISSVFSEVSGTAYDGYFKGNCLQFIRLVLKLDNDAGYDRGWLKTYAWYDDNAYGRKLYDYDGAYVVTQHRNDRDGMPTAKLVEEHFSKAHTADVVQMRWNYTQHTAIINGFEERYGKRGVHFFQANPSIRDNFYTFEELAQKYSTPGTNGGFTIYCFGHEPGGDSATWVNNGVKISDTFPDPLFREYVSNWDTNHDGYFSDAEIEAVTDFGWHAGPHDDNNPHNWSPVGVLANNGERWKNIRSIEGVKLFTNLEYLYIYNDSITGTVDISNMKNLKDFRCYSNAITQINASGCSALERLECQNNFDLISLNISGCSKLDYINASGCRLSSLGVDVSNTPYLKYLNVSNNRLSSLSVSLMDKLEELDCSYNRLTSLYIASASSLKKVICSANVQLSYLYLHVCPKLEEIYCRNTNLTKIYIPGQSRKNLRILERDSKLDVSEFLPHITSWNLPSTATVGQNYNGYIKADGAGVIYYSQNATAIANGIRIDDSTGKISGTPTTARSGITFKFTAQNFAGSDSKSVTISITGKSSSAPAITTSSINSLVKGTYYYPYSSSYYPNRAINASGGTTPMTWSVYSGKLPSGMSLSSSVNRTVYLVGKPTSTGRYSFTLMVRDKNGLSSTKRFTVVVQAGNVFTSSSAETVDTETEQETEIAED